MNVVLITVDSLRCDFVYDGTNVKDSLENLQALAEEGTDFTNAFSNACITKASFLSILSGTYPWMYGSIAGGFGEERPHIGTCFSEAGYTTGGFHSNPFLGPVYGYDRGFDYYTGRESEGELDGAGRERTVSTAVWDLFSENVPIPGVFDALYSIRRRLGSKLGIQLGGDPYLSAEEINDIVTQWLRETSGPRFLWVHYMDVHTPYYPHEGTVSEGISKRRAIKLFHRVDSQREDAAAEDVEVLKQLYKGEIEYFDRRLGNLLDTVDDYLALDNTLVAFTSDHGEAFKEHDAVLHPDGVLYDEHTHIPMIVRGPEFGSTTSTIPVSNVDLMPTLLAASDVPIPPECTGEDLKTVLDQEPDERTVFAEAYSPENGKVMVTDGTYKLIRHLDDGTERLYNRQGDPNERHDLAEDILDVRARLSRAVDDHVSTVQQDGHGSYSVEITEDVRSRLRRLGYDE